MENKYNYLIILALGISIVLFFLALCSSKFEILEEREILAKVTIGETSGFDANPTMLSFGTITHNSFSKREVMIENNYNFPIQVEVFVEGNISKILLFEKRINLDSGEKEIVEFRATVLNGEEQGFYSGKVKFIFEKII